MDVGAAQQVGNCLTASHVRGSERDVKGRSWARSLLYSVGFLALAVIRSVTADTASEGGSIEHGYPASNPEAD